MKRTTNQRKAMFARLKKGTTVKTPALHVKGVYAGKTKKGYKVITNLKTKTKKPVIIFLKTKPRVVQ